jgi:hypothetical protein
MPDGLDLGAPLAGIGIPALRGVPVAEALADGGR